MVSPRFVRGLLPALMLAALPAAVLAQEPAPAPAPAPFQGTPPEVQGWLAELQQLHGRLEGIQQKALTDPALSQAQDALGTSIRQAMQTIDPALEQGMTRIQSLEAEASAAQQTGDQVRLQAIGEEAQQIQQKFLSAQQQALARPELAAQVEAFQGQLEKKMLEVDPEAGTLISRFQELEQKLSALMQGGAR